MLHKSRYPRSIKRRQCDGSLAPNKEAVIETFERFPRRIECCRKAKPDYLRRDG
jgi:hypothetical protein